MGTLIFLAAVLALVTARTPEQWEEIINKVEE